MEKENIEVVIMGKVYTISGDENKDYLQKVATYLDSKMHEISKVTDFKRMSTDYKQLLVNLNVADDYFKVQEWAMRLENDKEKTQKEIFKLKQRIVDLEMELGEKTNELRRIEKELETK